jgi:hypothetical protein
MKLNEKDIPDLYSGFASEQLYFSASHSYFSKCLLWSIAIELCQRYNVFG